MPFSEATLVEVRRELDSINARRQRRAAEERADMERAAALSHVLRVFGKQDQEKNPPAQSFRDLIRLILREKAGERHTIGQVVAAIVAKGYVHEGKTPLQTKVGNELYKLSKTEEISNDGRGMYWIA
jgi:hypothetical protein